MKGAVEMGVSPTGAGGLCNALRGEGVFRNGFIRQREKRGINTRRNVSSKGTHRPLGDVYFLEETSSENYKVYLFYQVITFYRK